MSKLAISGDTYHNRYAPDRKHNKGDKKFKPLKKKCTKCGTTSGQLDINHKDGNRNNNNRSNLNYMCRSCHRSMHAKKNGGKGSVNIVSTASRIITPTFQEKAIASQHKNSDLMYIEFILCHEGVNKNQDAFLSEDLQSSASTAINKPINWEHRNVNIGVIYESSFVSVANLTEEAKASYQGFDPLEKDFVVCKACIWEYKHPREARIMRDRHAEGSLRFSMENLFGQAKCSQCQEVFDSPSEYCDHLLTRNQTGQASRIFIDSNFVASACVYNPADEGAVNLALAHVVGNTMSFARFIKSPLMRGMDIKNTIIPYIVNTEGFDMTIKKIRDIPVAYANNLDSVDNDLFADNVNRLFPLDTEENVEHSAELILNSPLEFYSDEEKIVVVERLAKSLEENNLTIETYIEDDKGGSTEMTIDKNSPEFIEAVKVAVANQMKEIESGVELEKSQTALATANEAKTNAEKALEEAKEATAKVQEDFDNYKAQIEAEKLASARLQTLTDEGIEIAPFIEKMAATASDEDFSEFVEGMKEAKAKFLTDEQKKKLEEEKLKKEKMKAKASGDPVTESNEVAIASKTDDNVANAGDDVVTECLKDLLSL